MCTIYGANVLEDENICHQHRHMLLEIRISSSKSGRVFDTNPNARHFSGKEHTWSHIIIHSVTSSSEYLTPIPTHVISQGKSGTQRPFSSSPTSRALSSVCPVVWRQGKSQSLHLPLRGQCMCVYVCVYGTRLWVWLGVMFMSVLP